MLVRCLVLVIQIKIINHMGIVKKETSWKVIENQKH